MTNEEPEAAEAGGIGEPFELPSKEARAAAWPLLRRMLAFSTSHWRALIGVVVFATVFTASRFVRLWLAKPMLDEVLVPAASESIDLAVADLILWQVGLVLALTLVISPIAMFGREYLSSKVLAKIRKEIDLAVAQKLLRAPLRVHRSASSGDLLSRALVDVRLACKTLRVIYRDGFMGALTLVGGILTLLTTNWRLTLVSAIAVPPSLFVLNYFGRRIRRQSRRRQEKQGDLSQRLVEMLSGIKVIKAFRGVEIELNTYARETDRYFNRHMKVIRSSLFAKASINALNQMVGTLILFIGGFLAMNNLAGVTIGTLAAFYLVLITIYKPLKDLTTSYSTVMESVAGAARLFHLLDMQEEPADRANAVPMVGLSHSIRFRDVHFRYDDKEVLSGVDLEIKPGEVIACVGRSGSGKSTLMDLLLRLHDPSSGSIEIDGVDLRNLQRESLLNHIAIVTQEAFLFDTTIAKNIRYGRYDASSSEVRKAAKAASADTFIEQLPRQYVSDQNPPSFRRRPRSVRRSSKSWADRRSSLSIVSG